MRKSILLMAALATMVLFGCKERAYIDGPGDNSHNISYDSIPVEPDPEPSLDPEGIEIPEGTIGVNEAFKIGRKLAAGTSTPSAYYIKGWVARFNDAERSKPDFEDKFNQYGNDYVYLSARSDGQGPKSFYCYRILGRGGSKLPSHDVLQIGDFVVIKCKIQNYNGTIENDGTCSIEVSNNAAYNEAFPPVVTINATCAEAKAAAMALGSGGTSKELYIVEGYVQSAGYSDEISRGQQKYFWIDDQPSGGKVLEAYWCNVPDGVTPVPVGAKVRLTGYLMNYNGSIAEIKNGDIEILEAPQQ